jgi:hypothetical protein
MVCPQRSETIEDMGYEDMTMPSSNRSETPPPPSLDDMGYEEMVMDAPKGQRGYSSRSNSVALGDCSANKRRGSLTFSNVVNELPRAIRRYSNAVNEPEASKPRRVTRRSSVSHVNAPQPQDTSPQPPLRARSRRASTGMSHTSAPPAPGGDPSPSASARAYLFLMP